MRKELKIGIFAVIVLVVSFFVLNYLRGRDIFNKEIEVVSRFENVEGLVASAPVYIKGYKAGKVVGVDYDTAKGDFLVTCSVSKDFKIPEDSKMIIYSVDIMGGKGVKISLGTSDKFAKDGSNLTPEFEAGLMDGLSAGVGPLLSKVTSAIDSLSITISGISSVLSDENIASVTNSLSDLETTLAEVKGFAANINGKSPEINKFIDSLSDFSNSLGQIVEKVDTTVVGVNEFVETLNVADVEGLITSIKELLVSINNPNGTVGQLLHEDSVYNSVDSLLNHVNSLVEKIQENPKKYLKISVF